MPEAHAQWEALRADPSTRSDLGGPTSSRLRLSIPANLVGACFEESSKIHYQGQYAEQSSRAMKSLKVEDLDAVKRDLFKGYVSMSNVELRNRFEDWETGLPGFSMLSNVLQEATGLSADEAAVSVLTQSTAESIEPLSLSSGGSKLKPHSSAAASASLSSEGLSAMAIEDCCPFGLGTQCQRVKTLDLMLSCIQTRNLLCSEDSEDRTTQQCHNHWSPTFSLGQQDGDL